MLDTKFLYRYLFQQSLKGLSIHYVVSVGGKGGSSNNDLLNRPYLIKKTRGGRVLKIAAFETT